MDNSSLPLVMCFSISHVSESLVAVFVTWFSGVVFCIHFHEHVLVNVCMVALLKQFLL